MPTDTCSDNLRTQPIYSQLVSEQRHHFAEVQDVSREKIRVDNGQFVRKFEKRTL
jgi:hypothetical protein